MYYCAHAIFYYELKNEKQDSILVHENIYMIEAANYEDAMKDARVIAKENEDLNDEGYLELNEKEVRYIFAGLRKLILVDEQESLQVPSGTEISYSVFEVDSFHEVEKLVSGEFVNLLYRE